MGARIDIENKQEQQQGEIKELQRELKKLQDVVAEALEALMSTKQIHHVDLHDDEEYTSPVGKRAKATKRKTATVD